MILGTHILDIGLSKVLQLPLHYLLTHYTDKIKLHQHLHLHQVFLKTTDTHSNAFVLIILNKLIIKPINRVL